MNEQNRGNKAGGKGKETPTNKTENCDKTRYERGKEYCRRLGGYIERHGPAIEAVSAAIIAGFTIALFIVSRWSWQASTEQVRAARDAIDVSRQSIELSERPWLLFDPVPADNPVTPDPELNWMTQQGVGVFVHNFGKAPASEISASIWVGAEGVMQRLQLPTPRAINLRPIPLMFVPVIQPFNALPREGWSESHDPFVPKGTYGTAIGSRAINQLLAPGKSTRVEYRYMLVGRDQPRVDDVLRAIVSLRYRDPFRHWHSTVFCVIGRVGNSRDTVHTCNHTNYAD